MVLIPRRKTTQDAAVVNAWDHMPRRVGHRSLHRPRNTCNETQVAGNPTTIQFDPDFSLPSTVTKETVMVHELLHGIRFVKGLGCFTRVPHWKNREEFYAYLVENMYRSVAGLPLRTQYQPITFGSIDAVTWVDDYVALLHDLKSEQGELYRDLNGVKTAFNPMKEVAFVRSKVRRNMNEWRGRQDELLLSSCD